MNIFYRSNQFASLTNSLFPRARAGPILTSLWTGCKNQDYFQGIYCNTASHRFHI